MATSRSRVLFFCPSLGQGGADRIVVTLLRTLDRARFQPILLLVRRSGALLGEIPRDVEVHSLEARRLATSVPALARALRTIKPDVVFSTHGAANIIAVLGHRLSRSRSRLVLSERSALVRSDRGVLRRILELPAKRATYRRAALVTAVSHGVAADLIRIANVPAERVRVVHHPIVEDRLAELAQAPCEHPWFLHRDVPVLLAVGRLVEIKDYPTMLRAFQRVRAKREVRLAILGDGPMRGQLEALASTLGVESSVAFLGFDSNPFRYMARATVLVHSSLAEGQPAVLVQAMACGTPVVATDCDHGPREVISHPGVNGMLVPLRDHVSLAENIVRLLEDRALYESMRVAARQSVSRFNIDSATAAYEAAITGYSR